jgi:hypothetical protein
VELYNISSMATEYSYYAMFADGYAFGNQTSANMSIPTSEWNAGTMKRANASQFPVIVDSGTTLNFLPSAIAKAYALQFDESKASVVHNSLNG